MALASINRVASSSGGVFDVVLRRLRLTIVGALFVVLIAGCWGLARFVGARALYIMAYGACVVVLAAYLIARSRLKLEVRRDGLSGRAVAGQRIEVQLVITARRRVSTVVLHEEMSEILSPPLFIPVETLKSNDELLYDYSIRPSLRGIYQVGPLVARWSDPFGLTRHSQVIGEVEELIVHPSTEAVDDRVITRMWEDPPVRPPVSKPWPVGFEFYGMREYVPGDDLRRIVWAAVARTGRMMVRESEQGITDRVVVLIDSSAESNSPGAPSSTFETAVNLAASVGAKHLRDGFAVSLLTNEGLHAKSLRGNQARLPLLDEMARVQTGPRELSDGMQHLIELSRESPHVLLLTSRLDERAAAQLKVAVDRGANVVVAQMEWEESDPATLARATAIGCRVVRVPEGTAPSLVFASGARRR